MPIQNICLNQIVFHKKPVNLKDFIKEWLNHIQELTKVEMFQFIDRYESQLREKGLDARQSRRNEICFKKLAELGVDKPRSISLKMLQYILRQYRDKSVEARMYTDFLSTIYHQVENKNGKIIINKVGICTP